MDLLVYWALGAAGAACAAACLVHAFTVRPGDPDYIPRRKLRRLLSRRRV